MHLKLVEAPAKEPLGLEVVWNHLRLDDFASAEEHPDYTLVQSLIKTARKHLEGKDGWLGRAFITQKWDLYMDAFPCDGIIRIPLPPLQEIVEIHYTDCAGTEQLLDDSNYLVDTVSEPARVTPAYSKVWPSTRQQINAVRITFLAGYGDEPENIEEPLLQAMLLLIGHYYEHREAVSEAQSIQTLPMAVDALCAPYRIFG